MTANNKSKKNQSKSSQPKSKPKSSQTKSKSNRKEGESKEEEDINNEKSSSKKQLKSGKKAAKTAEDFQNELIEFIEGERVRANKEFEEAKESTTENTDDYEQMIREVMWVRAFCSLASIKSSNCEIQV